MHPFCALVTFVLSFTLAVGPAARPAVKAPRVLWKIPLGSHCFGGPAVADVDGDGRLEVAFATYFGDSAVHVLRGDTGKPVWKFQGKDECLDASLKFCDVNADGKLDVVVPISNTSLVLALDARTGRQIWKYEAGYGECIDTPPTIVDTDGDGKPEVLVGTFKSNVHVIRGTDGTLVRKFKAAPAFVQSEVTALDCDADGTLDYVVGNFRGDNCVHAVSGRDGRELWKARTGNWIYHGCAVGDLDGDGKPELTIGSYDGRVYCINPRDGKIRWSAKTGDTYIMSPTTIADVDGDGRPEVLTASQNVTAIKSDGRILYSVPADGPRTAGPLKPGIGVLDTDGDGKPDWPRGNEAVTRGVSVADLDGDGKPDLACVNSAGLFRAVRGSDGALLYEFDAADEVEGPLSDGSCGVAIADLNGDGKLDAFFVVGGGQDAERQGGKGGGRYGMAIALTGFEGRGEGWYMMRHDLLNTGNAATKVSVPGTK